MIRKVFIIFLIIFYGCKPYYNLNKKYFISDNDIINYSSIIDFPIPVKINFNGNINYLEKGYKVKGYFLIKDNSNFQFYLNSKTLGVQILKVDFFSDSIIFIDRVNKKYFKGLKSDYELSYLNEIDKENILKLFFGRSFSDVNYLKYDYKNLIYKYENSNIGGEVIFNRFGYLEQNILWINEFVIQFNYNNYLKSSNVPSIITGSIKSNIELLNWDLNYYSFNKIKAKLKRFNIPNSYVKYDFFQSHKL